MSKLNLAVLFGGVSTEHEVSIISAVQVLNALNKTKYNIIPIYITKEGKWIRGDDDFFDIETFRKPNLKTKKEFNINSLFTTSQNKTPILNFRKEEKIDIALPIFHGRMGEDGCIQGLFEMANIPYLGCPVLASSIGMDKMITKQIAKSIDIPVLPANWITKDNRSKAMNGLKFPVYVKPARLGSSIGIARVKNKKELDNAVDVALFYDTKVIVEQGLANAKEVNISILGNNPYELSSTEMPVSTGDVLSFKDKYLSGGGKSRGMASLKRIIPAPIKKTTLELIQNYSTKFFSEIGGEGIARIDFLVSKDEKKIYLNEINTMPGSLAFYLWKDKGLSFPKLLDKLISLGLERHEAASKINTTFESNILSNFGGSKNK